MLAGLFNVDSRSGGSPSPAPFKRPGIARFAVALISASIVLLSVVALRIVTVRYDLVTGLLRLGTIGSWLLVLLEASMALLLLGTIGSWLLVLLQASMAFLDCSRVTRARFRLLLLTSFALLIGLELFLRVGLRRYVTYPEWNGRGYTSIYQLHGASWFFTHPGRELTDAKKEFTHSRQVNSLGLCEREIAVQKAPDEYRVLALGDSFTEGAGTSYESTWVKVLERRMAARMPGRRVTTINAGISGSDPFYEYILLRERLLVFHPDLVIVSVNPTDVNDVIVRGGMKRFRPDGSTHHLRSAPKWEWVYATSYIFRHVVHDLLHYNWILLSEPEMELAKVEALKELKSALVAFQRLSSERGFELLVVFHPSSYREAIDDRYSNELGRLIDALRNETSIGFVDLLEYYSRNRIMTKANAQDFFWPLDGHHNTEGYEVMGDAIAETMTRGSAGGFAAGPR